VLFAFDVGSAISLDTAQRVLAASQPTREDLSRERRTPSSQRFRPAPLQTAVAGQPIAVGRSSTAPSVQCTLFDFGAISVAFRIPLSEIDLVELGRLARDLYEHRPLLAEARRRVAELVALLGSAIAQPNIDEIVEDYVVYQAEQWSGSSEAVDASGSGSRSEDGAAAAILRWAPGLARVLRAADEPLSDEEIADAVSTRLSYGREDVAVIDWNASILLDRRPQDVLAVLEFANVELLEMRLLDDRLDDALDRSLESLSRRTALRADREERRRLALLQIDGALLFEGINNALKLVGDQYLARVYRATARRFHLPEWDESVMRKLETVQRFYEKLSDEQSARRMEVLEWIIIILIAVSIVLPFLPGVGGK
jgi:hypothetical protein